MGKAEGGRHPIIHSERGRERVRKTCRERYGEGLGRKKINFY